VKAATLQDLVDKIDAKIASLQELEKKNTVPAEQINKNIQSNYDIV
jgi:hypothetical protein